MKLDAGWERRAVSADDTIGRLASGSRVFVHGAAATPTPLHLLISIAHPDFRAELRRELAAIGHFTV